MTKELQDLAWSVLPKEFREEVKYEYSRVATKAIKSSYDLGFMNAHEGMYGIQNLTSDAEGEDEMLTVSRKKVQEEYRESIDKAHTYNINSYNRGFHVGCATMLGELFGSKCRQDETCNVASNVASKEPNPAEPKEDNHSDNIIKDGFSKERRLNIAKDFASVLLSRLNYDPFTAQINCCCSDGATVNPYINIARIALSVADALIAESEKGVNNA